MADLGGSNPRAESSRDARRGIQHPGMMGDQTEEQNLSEEGDPEARISEEDLDEGFGVSRMPHLPRFWAGFATGVVAALAASRFLSRGD